MADSTANSVSPTASSARDAGGAASPQSALLPDMLHQQTGRQRSAYFDPADLDSMAASTSGAGAPSPVPLQRRGFYNQTADRSEGASFWIRKINKAATASVAAGGMDSFDGPAAAGSGARDEDDELIRSIGAANISGRSSRHSMEGSMASLAEARRYQAISRTNFNHPTRRWANTPQ
ncbi:hypothetical protein HDU84_003722 [Entophlyctis sp. JEL0112]|nr:hypothetical protein HDU84_003722 [Entophlyctis sp. JEL0112]